MFTIGRAPFWCSYYNPSPFLFGSMARYSVFHSLIRSGLPSLLTAHSHSCAGDHPLPPTVGPIFCPRAFCWPPFQFGHHDKVAAVFGNARPCQFVVAPANSLCSKFVARPGVSLPSLGLFFFEFHALVRSLVHVIGNRVPSLAFHSTVKHR